MRKADVEVWYSRIPPDYACGRFDSLALKLRCIIRVVRLFSSVLYQYFEAFEGNELGVKDAGKYVSFTLQCRIDI